MSIFGWREKAMVEVACDHRIALVPTSIIIQYVYSVNRVRERVGWLVCGKGVRAIECWFITRARTLPAGRLSIALNKCYIADAGCTM